MMESIIKVDNVIKKFGSEIALNNVSIEFERGKIYGIVGRNGSGKTVLFKTIIGFLKPASGRVIVDGKEIGKDTDFADNIGIIIETPGFLSSYSGYKNLEYLASIKNMIGKKEIKKAWNGLDNQGVEDVRKILQNLKNEGKSIILASHNKEDINALCDEVYEMDKGTLNRVR